VVHHLNLVFIREKIPIENLKRMPYPMENMLGLINMEKKEMRLLIM